MKSEKVLDENYGPLSLTNVSGMPWHVKIDLSLAFARASQEDLMVSVVQFD